MSPKRALETITSQWKRGLDDVAILCLSTCEKNPLSIGVPLVLQPKSPLALVEKAVHQGVTLVHVKPGERHESIIFDTRERGQKREVSLATFVAFYSALRMLSIV